MTPEVATKSLRVLVFTLDGFGHVNACVGICQKLAGRGHKVFFALEQGWKGTLAKIPELTEVHYTDKTRDASASVNEHWNTFMDSFKQTFAKDPFEVLELSDAALEEEFFWSFLNVDDQLKQIIDEIKPDVILLDSYVTVPAVYNSGRPWVRMTSAAPLIALPSDDLPPPYTGFAIDSDRALWRRYLVKWEEYLHGILVRFNAAMVGHGIPEHPPLRMIHPSPHLNIYAYPLELDYLDIRPLPANWARFDHFIRETETAPGADNFSLPDSFIETGKRLVYISMGSLGSTDSDLIQRMIDMTANTDHRYIISLGPHGDKFKLAPNQFGAKFLPQTKILPLVDLVITHGGNNSLIESLYNGKPVIVTALFADQLDNAQRVVEADLGKRINPYECTREELISAIDTLLNDSKLLGRVHNVGQRMRESKSTELAAIEIERLGLEANNA